MGDGRVTEVPPTGEQQAAPAPHERVELSILACPADLPFLEATVRHQARALTNAPTITRRTLVIDLDGAAPASDPAGAELARLGDRLVDEGVIDRWAEVSWEPALVAHTMKRWYGDERADPKTGRRAIYQYMRSVDMAEEPRVLHVDSDMLFHSPHARWLEAGRALLAARDDVGAVVPYSGVPQATRPFEWIAGIRADRPLYSAGWGRNPDFTSRAFLLERSLLDGGLLPLATVVEGEQWEQTMARGMARMGRSRFTYCDPTEYCLHPHVHNAMHARHIESLIELVEQGHFPYRRQGYPWDITTEGRRFIPWWLMIQSDGLRRRLHLAPAAIGTSAAESMC